MKPPSLQYLERYRNEGTRTYSSHAGYTEAQAQYRPDTGHAGFHLHGFRVPRDAVLVYTANPDPQLAAAYLDDRTAMVCIHPQVLQQVPDDPYVQRTRQLAMDQVAIPVVPSSSTRTLFVQDRQPEHALKVHFPFKISRYGRKMRQEVLEQAINVSRELEAGIGQMDHRFAFMREVIGVSHRSIAPDTARGEHWGYLVREMTPYPHAARKRWRVPGFALYGTDFFDPDSDLLLYALIGDRNPVEYLLEQIMLPIIRHWVAAFRHFGYLLEPHGQNVLLELDDNRRVVRIVHRDLSVGIDMRRRRDVGLEECGLNQYNRMENSAFHSITYDRFMGTHFFDRLVSACMARYPGLSPHDFTRPCREAFSKWLPEYRAYFPSTQWYFSEARDRYNKPLYQDTGKTPVWRPAHSHCKAI